MNKLPTNSAAIVARLVRGETMAAVGNDYNVTRQAVSYYLSVRGIKIKKPPLPIGCENCKVDTLCNKCYQRHVSRIGLKPKQLKAIGCENCESEPYAKGLCNNCYKLDYYHKNKHPRQS